jgi:hypothetical protein
MASDLRNLQGLETSGAARAQAQEHALGEQTMPGLQGDPSLYETTIILPVEGQEAPSQQEQGKAGAFVLDLDSFSRDLEAQEQALLREEEEARRKKEEALQRWSETEVKKREEFERQRLEESQRASGASATGADTGSRRGALELLKKKATTRPSGEDAAAQKAKADADLDQNMRAGLQYLAEIARELNGVNPTAERPYDYVYLGRLPAVTLSKAFVDLRNRKINGKDHGDHLFFKFRVQPATPAKATVRGADIARCHEYFKLLGIPYESKTEAKGDFGQPTSEAFTVPGPLPCEVNIRADYDKSSFEVELVNVRRPGRVRCRVEPKEFDDRVDDLARYLLGVDDDFDKVVNRR